MIKQGLADKWIAILNKEILADRADILQKFSIEIYIKDMKSYPELCSYNHISPKLKALFENILSNYGEHVLALYNKLAISLLIKDSVQNLRYAKETPDSILDLYRKWFENVLHDSAENIDAHYSYKNDAFLKELGVCTLRLVPVGGAWVVEKSGIWRKFLLTGGYRQFIEGLQFSLLKIKAFKPFYQIHTADRYLDGFNSDERDQAYLRISELLKLNPEMKGFFALSWLYDPELENVSPRLAYLRKIPEQNGAKVFKIGSGEDDIKNALAKSPTRKKIYDEGSYIPTSYLLIWPRKSRAIA